MKKELVITFDENVKEDILKAFKKETRDDGIIIESDTKKPVIGVDSTEVHIDSFAGIAKGSEIIILKKDIPALIDLIDREKND